MMVAASLGRATLLRLLIPKRDPHRLFDRLALLGRQRFDDLVDRLAHRLTCCHPILSLTSGLEHRFMRFDNRLDLRLLSIGEVGGREDRLNDQLLL